MPPIHNIYGDNPYEYEVDLTMRRGTDGEVVPATGLLSVEMFVADPDVVGRPPIHNDLVVLMAERSAVPGRYHGTLPTSAINAHLKGVYNRQKVVVVADDTLNDQVRVESEVTFLDVRRI